MKRIALFIAITIVSFTVGLIGLYFAMPIIDPDGVEQTRSQIDSLLGLRAPSPIDSVGADSLLPVPEALAFLDSLSAEPDSLHAVPVDDHPRFIAMTDSLTRLRVQFASLDRERGTLLARIEALEADRATASQQSVDAAELSATLTRLEDEELRRILSLLDETSLTRLYNEATGRNKTRILAALPSERAARIVQRMMAGSGARPSSSLYTSDPGVQ